MTGSGLASDWDFLFSGQCGMILMINMHTNNSH